MQQMVVNLKLSELENYVNSLICYIFEDKYIDGLERLFNLIAFEFDQHLLLYNIVPFAQKIKNAHLMLNSHEPIALRYNVKR